MLADRERFLITFQPTKRSHLTEMRSGKSIIQANNTLVKCQRLLILIALEQGFALLKESIYSGCIR